MVKTASKTKQGRAKTAAERQKAYRERRARDVGEQRINAWVSARALATLSSLAIRYGVTQKVMLERLILKEDDGRIVTAARSEKRKMVLESESNEYVTQSQAALWDEPVVQVAPVPRRDRRRKAAG